MQGKRRGCGWGNEVQGKRRREVKGGAGKGMEVQGQGRVGGKGMQVQGRRCRGFKEVLGKGCRSKKRGAGKEGGAGKGDSQVPPSTPQRGSSEGISM